VTATVFGCSGFLGRYVVSRFGQHGSRVVCPHRCDHLDMQHLQPMGDLGAQRLSPKLSPPSCVPVAAPEFLLLTRLSGFPGAIITAPDFSIRDDAMIRDMVAKSNVVINLVAAERETWNYGFDEVFKGSRVGFEGGRAEN